MILAGDIGATHIRLALFPDEAGAKPFQEKILFSKDYERLIDALKHFLKDESCQINAACLGVAGPVSEGRCQLTNLPWMIDSVVLSQKLKIPSVSLINDLQATALGIMALEEQDLFTLNTGRMNTRGKRVVIAAGSGLGEALLFWDGVQYQSSATEGGHCDFAPRNITEIQLLSYLLKQYQHVSYERVLSGPGLLNIYRFLEARDQEDEVAGIAERFQKEDPSSVISELALTQHSERCVKSLDLFVSIYGAEAGNLALKTLASGGVYIAGGIAPKILKKLKDGIFMKAFLDKGRFTSLMEVIPVKVILNEKAALLGAAYKARQRRS